MTPLPDKKDIKGFEFKHATYCRNQEDRHDDLLVVKEIIHTQDGGHIKNLRMVRNYPKKFYITYPGKRTYNDKIEWEHLENLQSFETNQAQLLDRVKQALNETWKPGGLKQIAQTPYLFGADISTATLLNKKYKTQFPDCISDNEVAVLDIENDVVEGHGRILCVGITFKDKAFIAATEEYVGNTPLFEESVRRVFHEQLKEIIEARNITLEVSVVPDAARACYEAIQKAHQWQPDFVTIWNIDYDLPRIVAALKAGGYNLADVFSDPRVPHEYRFFEYIQGKKQRITSSNKVSTIPPSEQWHVALAPASFYWIDSMCVYRFIRLAKQKEASYSLDYQLNKHLGLRKLKFNHLEEINEVNDPLMWHQVMQSRYKVEYAVYNLFDCIGVELFDDKVKDLKQTISVLSGVSEYRIFDSQPKRLIDQLYFLCLEKGMVIATLGDIEDPLDDHVVSPKHWIVTLASHMTTGDGLENLEELPGHSTQLRAHVADADLSAAYPSGQLILNISKETTYREVSQIQGTTETQRRMAGINMTAAKTNAVEVCQSLLSAPSMDTLLEAFKTTKGL